MRFLLPALIALSVSVPADAQQPDAPPMTAKQIRNTIDDATQFLRSQIRQDGSVYADDGQTSLVALTLLATGSGPNTDDQLKLMLDWLSKRTPDNTYIRGIRANVWEYALRKTPQSKLYQKMLKQEYDWLIAAIGDREGWRYNMGSRDWDNSCTQYGVLGVWAAARGGHDPGEKFWDKLSKHFQGCQGKDGGWSYTRGGSSANMATAGLASMFLVFDKAHGKNFYTKKNPRTFAEGEAAKVLASIDRGMKWLGGNRGNNRDGYYLYGIERTGVASGRKYIGGLDWFRDGADNILKFQQPGGSIPMGQWGGAAVNTCFCTLFLVYGGAPVAFNKLEYGDGYDWNLNPRDLANLSKEMWSAYERPLNWQTVSIAADAEELEAPILFISGSKAVKFNEEQMVKLREYVLRGGTILAEPSDHSAAFSKSMEELLAQMFDPREYPGHALKQLDEKHPIYSVIPQQWTKRPRVRGASNGSRTFFILSDEYLSADWQMNRTDSDAFKLATNLLFYATDLSELEGKYASLLPEDKPVPVKKDKQVHVARVKWQGDKSSPRDWNAAEQCWPAFADYAKHVTGCELKESVVALGKDDLEKVQVLHITGRGKFTLSPDERAAVKKFAEAGGTVVVDAYAGSTEFATSARAVLTETFGKLEPLPSDHVVAAGRLEGGADLTEGVRFKLPARQLLRKRGDTTRGQKLQVAMIDQRPAVVFSEFDICSAMAGIENYRAAGYKPQSACKIVGNLLAYVSAD